MKTKKKANPIKFLEGLQKDKKKMPIILTEDKLHSMLFDVEWDLAEKTQSLMSVLKLSTLLNPPSPYIKDVDEIENLLSQRYNIIGAQILIDEEENA